MMVCSFPLSALQVVWYDIVYFKNTKFSNRNALLFALERESVMKLELLLHGFGQKVNSALN